jgi:hypothetical protein
MANMTFTVRISPRDHELLVSLADVRNQTVAELSREILSDGIRRLLDPEEIERRLDAERTRLLAAAARIRQEAETVEEGVARQPSSKVSASGES